jgi:hypothetical protein
MVRRFDGRRHMGRAFSLTLFMKSNQLEKTDNTGQIKAALKLIGQAQSKRAMRRPPAPEIFDLHCFCAVHDKPYTLRFVKQPSGLLRFKESIRSKPAAPASDPAVFAIYYEGGVKVGWKLSMKFLRTPLRLARGAGTGPSMTARWTALLWSAAGG